jgi:diguanylate cyclase (GGDEF)-like protein
MGRFPAISENAEAGRQDSCAVQRTGRHLLCVVVLGLAATISVWGLLKDREVQLVRAEFASRACDRAAAIGRQVQDDVNLLFATSAFLAGSDNVTREDFQKFVQVLMVRAGSTLAIQWAPRVTHERRDEFEQWQEWETGITTGIVEVDRAGVLHPAGIRDCYFPVGYLVEPKGVPTWSIGFDQASQPLRWQAMQRAVETGDANTTERLALLRPTPDETDHFGVLVVLPVFDADGDLTTLAQRREHLAGFLFGVYRLSDIVRNALANFSDSGVNCRILDVTDGHAANDLHLHLVPSADKSGARKYGNEQVTPELVYAAPIQVPGRKWIVECWPTRQFMQSNASILPGLSVIGGLVGTCLLATLIWIVDGRADAVERIVVERTSELREANHRLEQEVCERMAAESKLAEDARNLEEFNRQLEQARCELERQAAIDPLTGVLNRLSLSKRFASEWSRACRQDRPLACVLLDIDFFKKINDTYGHPVGDAVLESLGRLLRDELRDYDCVARFGGEEFCILLPDTGEEDAVAWAERLRILIASTPMSGGAATFPITASMGVAARCPDLTDSDELLNQADEAMLVAKRQGRNRVIAFGDLHRLALATANSTEDVFHGACAQDIMTPVLVHLSPGQALSEAARVLLCLRLDSVPVIDADGRTLGIIGEEDLTSQILAEKGWDQVVGDVMNTSPVSYDSATPATEICAFLSRVTVRRVIILHGGRPVGLISRSTLIRWLRNALLSNPPHPPWPDGVTTSYGVTEQLHSTIDRLTKQVDALQQGVESSPGNVMPVVVSAATRIQELVDDALILTAGRDAESFTGYATMGAVLS